MPATQIRVIAGDVGGAFGAKGPLYPDQVAVIAAARALRRPVKWIEERSESFTATTHGRDQVADLELAADAAGNIVAMRGTVLAPASAPTYAERAGLAARKLPRPDASRRATASSTSTSVSWLAMSPTTTPIGAVHVARAPFEGLLHRAALRGQCRWPGRPASAPKPRSTSQQLHPGHRLPLHDLHRPLPTRAATTTPVSSLLMEKAKYQFSRTGWADSARHATRPGHRDDSWSQAALVPRAPGPDGTIGDRATVTVGLRRQGPIRWPSARAVTARATRPPSRSSPPTCSASPTAT